MAALEYGFYDSYEHDRLYNAEQMNSIFEGVITDGVYAGVGNHFAVHPGTGLQVVVDTGRAWFKMTWNKNRTLTPLYLDMSDPVYSRIDTICIRVRKNLEHRMNDFYVYRGNVTSNPTPPILNDTSDTFYLPLANVTVRPNAESISDADIEMLVGKTRCPFVTSILQQTDITDLFKQWEGQFIEWWESVRHILDLVEGGNIGEIFLEINKKVDRSEKATAEDVNLNSDSKWMTPLRTREMIDKLVGEEVGDIIKNGVVTSFKGRSGAVIPQSGDYTAAQVGALATTGGTLSGPLNTTSINVGIGSQINVPSGSSVVFGSNDNMYITKSSSVNRLTIVAPSVNLQLTGSTGNANTNFLINGVNPFSGLTGGNNSSFTGTLSQIGFSTITNNSARTVTLAGVTATTLLVYDLYVIVDRNSARYTGVLAPYKSTVTDDNGSTIASELIPLFYNSSSDNRGMIVGMWGVVSRTAVSEVSLYFQTMSSMYATGGNITVYKIT